MRWYLHRAPDLTRITLTTITQPSPEALEAEEWLRTTSRPGVDARPAISSDFTARVLARIETPAAEPVVVISQKRPLSRALRPLSIVGGVVGFSGVLILASLAVALVAAPGALVTLLNALVGVLVAALLLLTPLLDAAGALAANNTLMLGLSVFVAGFVLVWSRVAGPSGQLANEA